MKSKYRVSLMMISVLILMVISGCSGNPKTTLDNSSEGAITGEITVLTHRTDIVDTVFKTYAVQFNKIYPDVKVSFEAMADYQGQVKVRMNSKDYGDVLMIPNDLAISELPNFFEPLGTVSELDKKYMFSTEKAMDGKVYGLPITGNAYGIVYNKKVFKAAGIENFPKTSEAFLEAMKKIKAKTDAIPVYTNYAAGWPLTQWENYREAVAGDPDFVGTQLVKLDAPFSEGNPHHVIYKLMYDLVDQGLVEKDPMTSDWESSKQMLADGKIGAMVLGSWVISQVKEIARNPEDIGYIPFPHSIDGKIYASAGGDYKIGINVNSNNKAAARAWLDWFLNESNFAYDQGGIPPLKGKELPEDLKAFSDLGVEFITNNPAPSGQESWVHDIDREAEIGLWQDDFKKRIIEAGQGSSNETYEVIAKDLNVRWKEGKNKLLGN